MPIHIGKKIKEELRKQKMPVTVFAKKINLTRNVAYNIFKRESIATDLLNRISKVLNCDFFSAYSAQKEYSLEHVKSFNAREPEVPYGKHAEELELLQQQNQQLMKEVAYLKKIIGLMEDKKSGKARKK